MPAKPSTNDMGASAHTMCEHVLADMHRVAAAIKQAQSACGLGAEVCEFGSAPTHTHHRQVPATVSSTTRRRAAARAANGLQQAAACVEGAVQGLQQLQLATASHKKKVTTLSGRYESTTRKHVFHYHHQIPMALGQTAPCRERPR